MKQCLKCKKEATYGFRVLEVQTLHVRDVGGESRVQALGEFQNYSICSTCAESQMEVSMNPRSFVLKNSGKYAAVLVVGIFLLIGLWNTESPLRILGPAAIICGILGIYAAIQKGAQDRRTYAVLTPEEAMERAAWEILLQEAPKKSEDSDLTYIPIVPRTLAMKNGDLMIGFDLLPEVAVKAFGMIHENPS